MCQAFLSAVEFPVCYNADSGVVHLLSLQSTGARASVPHIARVRNTARELARRQLKSARGRLKKRSRAVATLSHHETRRMLRVLTLDKSRSIGFDFLVYKREWKVIATEG